MLVKDFYPFHGQYTDVPNIRLVALVELAKVDRVIKFLNAGLAGTLTKLPPH